MSARIRVPNLTNALVFIGCVLLALTVYVPGATAERTARVETRAEEAARALLAVGSAAEPIRFDSPEHAARIRAAFREACAALDHPGPYLPELREKPPSLAGVDCFVFDSRHYCFMLARGEPPGPDDPRLPLEVYAWPQSLTPPGHTAFFFPEVGEPAFTRNLVHRYVGWDENPAESRKLPRPGAGVPHRGPSGRDYRGRDNERWIMLRS